jgi:prepilin-type N-terminal cleavage/methylation domain-containing protein
MSATPQRRQRGFSMLELLLVCTIIGIIAAITVPRLILAKRVTEEGRAVASLRNLGSAQLTYHSAAQRYGTFEELIAARAIPPQFIRGVGGTTGQTEVVSDGVYGYGMTFEPGQGAVIIDASPLQDPEKYRFFRFRLGGGDGTQADGVVVLLEADPTSNPPPANSAYHIFLNK